jgi:hypothetical protein
MLRILHLIGLSRIWGPLQTQESEIFLQKGVCAFEGFDSVGIVISNDVEQQDIRVEQ